MLTNHCWHYCISFRSVIADRCITIPRLNHDNMCIIWEEQQDYNFIQEGSFMGISICSNVNQSKIHAETTYKIEQRKVQVAPVSRWSGQQAGENKVGILSN